MEVGSGYVVPGEAGQGTRFEAWSVVCETGDDHLQNLCRKSVRLSICSRMRGTWGPGDENTDYAFGPVPSDAGDEVDSCYTSATAYENQDNQEEQVLNT